MVQPPGFNSSVEYQCIMDVFTLSSLIAQVRGICVNSIKGSCPKWVTIKSDLVTFSWLLLLLLSLLLLRNIMPFLCLSVCVCVCILLISIAGSSSSQMLFVLSHWRPCLQHLVSEHWRFFNPLPVVVVHHTTFCFFVFLEEKRREKTNKKFASHCVKITNWSKLAGCTLFRWLLLGTRPSMRKSKQHSIVMKNPCMSVYKIDTERDRDRHKEKRYIPKGNLYKWQPTLTKGYKVTLYSDWLRATALYAIYINSLNLGCPKGQCEYGHYTLVFDSPP